MGSLERSERQQSARFDPERIADVRFDASQGRRFSRPSLPSPRRRSSDLGDAGAIAASAHARTDLFVAFDQALRAASFHALARCGAISAR
jgi:hypothetical protein